MVMVPPSTRRTRWLALSAIQNLSGLLGSAASPMGVLSSAEVAAPLSPVAPPLLDDLPATSLSV